jgi:hypothetical protein
LILVVLNLNVEHDVLGERVFYLEVNLKSFVQLCWLLDYLNWIPLVDIRYQFEDHRCSLNISFFFICKDYLALYLSWYARLKPNWESNALSRLYFNLFLLDWEIVWADQFYPVANWVLRWIWQLDVFGDQIS